MPWYGFAANHLGPMTSFAAVREWMPVVIESMRAFVDPWVWPLVAMSMGLYCILAMVRFALKWW